MSTIDGANAISPTNPAPLVRQTRRHVPNDILHAIMPFLSRHDLTVVARTNRRIHRLSLPYLYQAVTLGRPLSTRRKPAQISREREATPPPGTMRYHPVPPRPLPAIHEDVTIAFLNQSARLRDAIKVLRIVTHPACGKARPTRLAGLDVLKHLPNLQVLQISLITLPLDWGAPTFCFDRVCSPSRANFSFCRLTSHQTPATLVVHTKTWTILDVWSAIPSLFKRSVRSCLRRLVVVSDVSHNNLFPKAPTVHEEIKVELVQIFVRRTYPAPEGIFYPLTELAHWVARSDLNLTLVDVAAACPADPHFNSFVSDPPDVLTGFHAAIEEAGGRKEAVKVLTLDEYAAEAPAGELSDGWLEGVRARKAEGEERRRSEQHDMDGWAALPTIAVVQESA